MSVSASLETYFVHVTGHVQGVGYRASTVRQAHLLGVRGWVRNMPDGAVHAMVQGTPDQVDHMLEWMRRGPLRAQVEGLESRREYTERRFDRFEQR